MRRFFQLNNQPKKLRKCSPKKIYKEQHLNNEGFLFKIA